MGTRRASVNYSKIYEVINQKKSPVDLDYAIANELKVIIHNKHKI